VWLLQADAVIYRGALRFEEACAAVWEEERRVVTDYRLRTVSSRRVCPSLEPNLG
jgi:hypothetical protein